MTRPSQRRGDSIDAARRILDVVSTIPGGNVATYGRVARMAGLPRRARLVGTVLGKLGNVSPVPWHRVVNAQGAISRRPGTGAAEQRAMLEREGVVFGPTGRIDLDRFGWEG